MALRRVQSARHLSEVCFKKQLIDEEKKTLIAARYEHGEKVKLLREIFRVYSAIECTLNERARLWLLWLYTVLIALKAKQRYNV